VTSARDRAEIALRAATELGPSPEIARCHATLAKISARLDDASAAGEHLASAREIFERLGLVYWASRVGVA